MEFTEENFNKLSAQLERKDVEIEQLKQRLDWLLRKMFGRSSEKVDPNQMRFEFGSEAVLPGEPDAKDEVEEVKATRKKRTRRPFKFPENLPVVEEIIEPDEVLANPDAFKRIGEETFDQLDFTPAKMFIRRTLRPKYVLIDDRELPPVLAPAPKRIIDLSIASPALLLHMVISKYCLHTPLYRQAQDFKRRFGVDLNFRTMSGWMFQLAEMLAQIYESMREEMRAQPYLQVDETPIRYINPGNGVCSKGYLWVYNVPHRDVFFEWHIGRGNECMKKTLGGFDGYVQSDGYSAYETFRKENLDIKLLCCWAHARRKFFEAKEESSFAARIVEEIGNLYHVEKTLRENPELDQRTLRQEESVPVLQRMRLELLSEQPRHRPQSLTRKAINYTLTLWDKLNVYTEHSELEIDNNLVENAIRPTAVGKKNWLFFGGANGGQISAIFYTLIRSCTAREINPEEYLGEVFAALPEMTNQAARDWTPSAWEARRNPVAN